MDDDDEDPPVVFPKKKRTASSAVAVDKAGEAKLKRQLKKIMDIVIKYADRYERFAVYYRNLFLETL